MVADSAPAAQAGRVQSPGAPPAGLPSIPLQPFQQREPQGWLALRLASPSIAVPGVTTSASSASESSGF